MKKNIARCGTALFLTLAILVSNLSISAFANDIQAAPNAKAALSKVYVSNTGNDLNPGDSLANAVLTLEKALEIVADGGTVYVNGPVEVTKTVAIGKNVTLAYGNGASVTVKSGVNLSAGQGFVLTVRAEASPTAGGAIIVSDAASVGDGSYIFDVSKRSSDP